jgi:hypothetical protein
VDIEARDIDQHVKRNYRGEDGFIVRNSKTSWL